MENTIRFGIIGAGKIAHKFCDAVRKTEGAGMVAVASRTPGKAQAFAVQEGLDAAYDGYEGLLARADIDAVYVATTHNFHYENVRQALLAGKHVVCEKPFVLRESEAAELFDLAKSRGLFCMEAMWSRFLPHIRKVRSWIREGRIGTVELSNYTIGFRAEKDFSNRMYNPDLAGGAIYDLGVYAIEITTYLIPEELQGVCAAVRRAETGVDRTDVITLQYPHSTASLLCSLSCRLKQEMNIWGTDGSIWIPDAHSSHEAELYDAAGNLVDRFEFELDNGFLYEAQEAVRCIREGRVESETASHAMTLECARIFEQCLCQEKTEQE